MSKAKLFLAGFWLACAVAIPKLAESQQTVPLPIEEALRVRSFGQLVPVGLSPDGKWLAYTVQDNQRSRSVDLETYARTGVPSWSVGTDIWISNVENGETRNLTGGKGNNWLPVWSPNGLYLAFLSDRDGSGHARVWIWDSTKNELGMITDLEVRTNEIEWTFDSRKILVTTVPNGLSIEDYVRKTSSPVNERKRVVSAIPGSTAVLYHSSAASSADENSPKSDPWNLDMSLRDLVLVDVLNKKTSTIVQGKRIAEYRASPDGAHIAYTILKRFEKPGSQQILFDIETIMLRGEQQRVVASGIRFDYDGAAFSWSPNGSQLAFHTGGMEEGAFDCFVVDGKGGNLRNVSSLPKAEARSRRKSGIPLWDGEGEYLYFIRDGNLWRSSVSHDKAREIAHISNRTIAQLISRGENILWTIEGGKAAIVLTSDNLGKQDGFYKIDLESGRSTKLLEKGECYTCANVQLGRLTTVSSNGQKVAFFKEDATHDADLWISDLTFERVRRVTRLNSQFDKIRMGAVRLVDWLSDDGEQLKGAVLLPPDYEDGKRVPLVVWVYGGLSLSDQINHFGLGYRGPFNFQLLATRGYAVLLPDAPQHLGTPMLDLVKSVLPGIDKVIEMGIADPTRLAVMGHSYGGYSALALIVQSKRFKAAVDIDGMGNLITAYGQMGKDGSAFQTSITEQGQGLMGGTPWQFRERYIENSPFFYLDRVETPLLIVHGAADPTVASFLSDEVFVALRRLGKEVEYAKYEGEGHSPLDWSYANQLDFCKRMIAWFDEHLKKPQNTKGQSPSN